MFNGSGNKSSYYSTRVPGVASTQLPISTWNFSQVAKFENCLECVPHTFLLCFLYPWHFQFNFPFENCIFCSIWWNFLLIFSPPPCLIPQHLSAQCLSGCKMSGDFLSVSEDLSLCTVFILMTYFWSIPCYYRAWFSSLHFIVQVCYPWMHLLCVADCNLSIIFMFLLVNYTISVHYLFSIFELISQLYFCCVYFCLYYIFNTH